MKVFAQISTLLLGLLTGGMVLMAFGLVPYWRSLDPLEFTRMFTNSLPTVGKTLVILTISSTVSVILAAGLAIWKKLPSRYWLTAGAVTTIIVLATVPIYFSSANVLLLHGNLSNIEITSELKTWQEIHMFRTIVVFWGFFAPYVLDISRLEPHNIVSKIELHGLSSIWKLNLTNQIRKI